METITHEPLRVWRARKRWSQAQLAERSHISRLSVANIECGKHSPRTLTARAIAEALGVDQAEVTELRA